MSHSQHPLLPIQCVQLFADVVVGVMEEPIRVEIYRVYFEFVNVNSQSMPTVEEREEGAFPDLLQRTVEHGFPAAVGVRFVDVSRQLAVDTDLDPR